MKNLILIIILFITNFIVGQNLQFNKKPFIEKIHEKEIIDDYRNLENLNDSIVQQWFKANSNHANEIINSINNRDEWVKFVKDLENRRTTAPSVFFYGNNDSFYYLKIDNFNKSPKIYYKKSKDSNEILLFDPIDYKKDSGIEYKISYAKTSWDEKYIAISFTKKGEEIGEIAFFDIEARKILPKVLTNSWTEVGGIHWLKDNSGILYTHFPIIDRNDKGYIMNAEYSMYKINDNPENRKVLFSKKNNAELDIKSPDFPYFLQFEKENKYILAALGGTSSFRDTYFFEYKDLSNEKIKYKPLFKKTDGYRYTVVFEDFVYTLSSKKTPNYSIVRTNLNNPDFENPEIIVPESKTEVIDDYLITKNGLFYTTTKNGVEVKLYCFKDGKIKQIDLPIKAGRIFLTYKSKYDNHFWVLLSGWLNPNIRFKYNILDEKFEEANLVPSPVYSEFKNITVDEIEIPSHDGKLIPVSIIRNKNFKKNSNNNVIITSYGAYGSSQKPNFQALYLTWVLRGGIFVISHVRGGSEKGNDWYLDGFKETKPNTWKDLISTAEYLIKQKITKKDKIAIHGVSAGGITVGRAITERPDLFKVMLCSVGDLNTSRIKDVPNGPNNMKEFGNPDNEKEFNWLLEMDAYQHIKKDIKYPACLIDVGMNDARVAPWTSGKFVAKLRENTTSKNPIIFSVNYDSGHRKTNDEIINQYVNQFVFTLWQFGHPDFQPVKK